MLEEWNRRKALVEQVLARELEPERIICPRLADAMRYSLMAGGKRLRPILLMAAADALGENGDLYVTAGCAIEMIHTYSLIHDDLPAMDDDDLRRGRPTNHKIYGDGMAILAGDGLQALAFEVLMRQPGASPDMLASLTREVAMAAGPCGMVGGQAIDLESEGKDISLDILRRMHMGKTGAMFRASVRCGAILAGASEAQLAALSDYADSFGLAFQITDDILDVTGSEAAIGKPVGSDERNSKSTYVTLTSLDEAKELAANAVKKSHEALGMFGTDADFLRKLATYLLERKKSGLTYCWWRGDFPPAERGRDA